MNPKQKVFVILLISSTIFLIPNLRATTLFEGEDSTVIEEDENLLEDNDSPFKGFRAGLDLGMIQADSHLSSTYHGAASDNVKVGGWNAAGGFHFDIGKKFADKVYIGAEAGGYIGMGPKKIKELQEDASGLNYKIQERYLWAGSLKAGLIAYENILIYLKAGICQGRWVAYAEYHANSQIKSEKNLWGAILGGGVEIALNKRWTWGVAADYQAFNTMKFSDASRGFAWKLKPASLRLMVELNYKLFE